MNGPYDCRETKLEEERFNTLEHAAKVCFHEWVEELHASAGVPQRVVEAIGIVGKAVSILLLRTEKKL